MMPGSLQKIIMTIKMWNSATIKPHKKGPVIGWFLSF